jgi:predicted RNA methylase
MTTYLSTFIAGLGPPVRQVLKERAPSSAIELELDGLIVYRTEQGADVIRALPFFNNSFIVLRQLPGLGAGRGKEVLDEMLASMLRGDDLSRCIPGRLRGTFRIVTSWSNVLTSVRRDLLEQVERKISASERLRPHRGRPDHELWLSYRTEGYGFFLLRLTSHTSYEKVLAKGELRPELSYILCWLSEPREGELVLDPFCGSGAIPLMRASQFPRSLILASDLDEGQVERLKLKVKQSDLRRRVVVRRGDARDLSRYDEGSIHKIITDPPWGIFKEVGAEPEAFYREALSELCRVLAPGGIMVILFARTEFFLHLVETLSAPLELLASHDILVSGRKATVYKLRKAATGRQNAPRSRPSDSQQAPAVVSSKAL